jgi:hypothetical protein
MLPSVEEHRPHADPAVSTSATVPSLNLQARLVSALREALGAGSATPVELIESHSSFVLLSGQFA